MRSNCTTPRRHSRPAATAAAAFAVAALGWSGLPPAARGEAGPAAETARAAGDYERVRDALRLKNQPWATVAWKANITEARRLAAEQKKPIFLVVNTGNCLGFV